MLRARQRGQGTLFVVLGARCVEACVLANGQWQSGTLQSICIEPGQNRTAAIEALSQLHSTLANAKNLPQEDLLLSGVREVRVLVADLWLAITDIPWSATLMQRDGVFARSQFAAAGFEMDPADSVKIDDAPFGQPRLAVAYPDALLTALAGLAAGLHARLTSVLPFSVAAWAEVSHRRRDKSTALALFDEGLTLFAQGTDCLTGVTMRAVNAAGGDAAAQALREQWQRMQWRDPQLASVEHLPVLNLSSSDIPLLEPAQTRIALPSHAGSTAPSPRLQLAACLSSRRLPLDAVLANPPMTPMRWAIAGIALCLSGLLFIQMLQITRTLEARRHEAVADRMTEPTMQPSTIRSREEIARVQAVNGAIRELNLPISALLQALQPPRDIRVAIWSVDVQSPQASEGGQQASVKIVAESPTGADMTRYVAFVAESRPFTGAYLTHHAIEESLPARPYRFTLEAVWKE